MMYKIKIINYKPYEYELLQEKLNQLGKDCFQCKELSLISIFKKVNHPIDYKIDFFKLTGESQVEKDGNKEQFYYQYVDNHYVPIYKKHGMYVFMGENGKNIQSNNPSFITSPFQIKYLMYLVLAVFITALFIGGLKARVTIDTFTSYGICIAYLGTFLLCLTTIYRTLFNFALMQKFHQTLKNNQSISQQNNLSLYRFIYKILLSISLFLFIGGLTEDILNEKPFTIDEHPVIQFKDLHITGNSQSTYQQHTSFILPHSYRALETIDEDTVLFTKEYQLYSKNAADKLYKDVKSSPKKYSLTSVKEHQNILYGYNNKELSTLIIQKEKTVIFVGISFSMSDSQIDTIIKFYEKGNYFQ